MADAFSAAWSMRLIDHADADVASQPSLAALERGCRRAAQRRLEQPVAAEGSPFATADLAAAGALRVQPPATGGVSIAYVIMGHRRFAHATITRLLHALWDPAHLFLLHLDARTNATAVDELSARLGAYANVLGCVENDVNSQLTQVLAVNTTNASRPTLDILFRNSFNVHQRYYLENVRWALRPGTFYHDAASRRLYYWPADETPPLKGAAVAPILDRLIELSYSDGLVVSDLTFTDTTYYADGFWDGPAQQPSDAAIRINHATNSA
jgi:hypothetical protein